MEEIQKILGKNLKAIREKQKLSLEKASDLSGVSKAMIGQIERGESSPTITTIWKIANGLKVSFTSLINVPEPEAKIVLRSEVQAVSDDNGRYRVFPTFPFSEDKQFELYSIEIEPEGKLDSRGHKDGSEEYITVFDGEVLVSINGANYKLKNGDSIKFKADRPHSYYNTGDILARLSMTIYYPE
ncbi:helix-turn-helix domain-containing protein [Cytobacillus sp. IB215316]|uniref:helix-turn-helix domain-containing protein n=1 Tax=Cytobacillus sp. IB215316 TaxID=3097354 RepID=UPI002A0EF666|nr:helix-turn-helix domain-containing protein [Cytobacillus sp. IB215316]MDX8360522.1 helix-turn-helix domain-containing protein [Cytobacillus sp. IB215316]